MSRSTVDCRDRGSERGGAGLMSRAVSARSALRTKASETFKS